MYRIAEEVLKDTQIPFEALLPLIDQTAAKVHVMKPKDAQTGPAQRGDENVMNHHLEVLNQAVSGAGFTSQEKCEVYKLLSQLICQKTEK